MHFRVFDYREDITHILVAPQIRARFLRIEVEQVSETRRTNPGHSHDLGHEIFLVLQGQLEFQIEDDKQVLGPGQLCVALADQPHTVRNVGREPVILYLSVTPHIQPTHTMEGADSQAPLLFRPSINYDVPPDRETPTAELVARHLTESRALGKIVETSLGVQRDQTAALGRALGRGDEEAMVAARKAMWDAVAPVFRQVYELADAWNNLMYRTEDPEYWQGEEK